MMLASDWLRLRESQTDNEERVMQSIQVHRPVEHVLARRLLDPARAAGIRLEAIGVSPPPTGETLVQEPSGRWWIFNDHRHDPMALAHGGVIVPPDIRERLERLLANGFSADMILIGHELPGDWSPGRPIRAPGHASSYTTTSPGRDPHGAVGNPAAARAVANTMRSLVAVGAALGTSLARFAGALAELDPVVIAGAWIPNSDHLVYVEVARWSW